MNRPSNKSRAEILRLARVAIAEHGGPLLARVFFKYDCDGCAARVTVAEPNILPTRARCAACGAWTPITGAGYALHRRGRVDEAWIVPWDLPADGKVVVISRDYAIVPGQTLTTEIEP